MASNEKKIGLTNKGKLIICPTPLGNLGDITKRTLEAFSQCDVVCCEDTRVTGKLLSVLGIKKSLERLDEATLSSKAEYIAQRVLSGEIIAYASDAGMPGVSDPGQRLVDAALEVGAVVEVLPGPTALTTAYVASGLCPIDMSQSVVSLLKFTKKLCVVRLMKFLEFLQIERSKKA